jgi:hypothetical protein
VAGGGNRRTPAPSQNRATIVDSKTCTAIERILNPFKHQCLCSRRIKIARLSTAKISAELTNGQVGPKFLFFKLASGLTGIWILTVRRMERDSSIRMTS